MFPSGVKEIGFAGITLTPAGLESPLRHLAGLPVLHWHGDTYILPNGAVNLASSALIVLSILADASGAQMHGRCHGL